MAKLTKKEREKLLTPRELELMQALVDNDNDWQLALDQLGISHSTGRTHLSSVIRKTNTPYNRTATILWLLRRKVIHL